MLKTLLLLVFLHAAKTDKGIVPYSIRDILELCINAPFVNECKLHVSSWKHGIALKRFVLMEKD